MDGMDINECSLLPDTGIGVVIMSDGDLWRLFYRPGPLRWLVGGRKEGVDVSYGL